MAHGVRKNIIHDTFYSWLSKEQDSFDTITLSPRMLALVQFLGQQTIDNDTETGAFVVKTGTGMDGQVGARLVNIVGGEDRAISLEPQENLLQGEEYLGTFHAHPLTDTPSVHDFMTFLADPTEQLMLLHGSDGTINLATKNPNTVQLSPDQIETMKQEFAEWKDTEDKIKLADKFGFNLYQGKDADLQRVNATRPETGKKIMLDELILGMRGTSKFPTQSKKNPVKKKFEGTIRDYLSWLQWIPGNRSEIRKRLDVLMTADEYGDRLITAIEKVNRYENQNNS